MQVVDKQHQAFLSFSFKMIFLPMPKDKIAEDEVYHKGSRKCL